MSARRLGARVLLASSAAMLPMGLVACRTDGPSATTTTSDTGVASAMSYDEIARRYNERAERLGRLWSRAVVSIEFIDREGGKRYEQGDGFFQVVQPSKLALSVGKAGETFVWMGCDAERYWVLEPKQAKTASVGRHDLLTPAKLRALGLPCAPLELISLIGVSPLPTGREARGGSGGGPPKPIMALDGGADVIQFDLERGGQTFRYLLDAKTLRPRVVSIVDRATRKLTTTARLDNYLGVETQAFSGAYPMMPALVRVEHIPTSSVIKFTLESMNDGLVNQGAKKGRLAPENFDLDALVEAYGPFEMVDLDAAPAR